MIEWVHEMAPIDDPTRVGALSCMNGDELVGTVDWAPDGTWTAKNTEGITQYRFVTLQDAQKWVEREAK